MITVTETMAQIAAAEKCRKERMGRAQRDEEALTPAHEAARAEMDESGEPGRGAQKGYADRGITGGPDSFAEPAAPADPGEFRREYLGQGHAAPSPQYGPPRTPPLPAGERGALRQVQLPAAPVVSGTGPGVQSIAVHQARVGLATPVPQPPRGGQ